MGAVAAKMTMDATVWLAKNRTDLPAEVSVKLAGILGDIAERQNWVAPGPDFDPNNYDMADIQASIDNSEKLHKSVMQGEYLSEDQAAIFSSIANFLGYTVH